jgi:hypothetical protein
LAKILSKAQISYWLARMHRYLKNAAVPVPDTYQTQILQGYCCLHVPGVQFFPKENIYGYLSDTARKSSGFITNFFFVTILNTFLLFTLLDLSLYYKDHLMAMDILYYP